MRESSTTSEIFTVISETMISVPRKIAAIEATSATVSLLTCCFTVGRSIG